MFLKVQHYHDCDPPIVKVSVPDEVCLVRAVWRCPVCRQKWEIETSGRSGRTRRKTERMKPWKVRKGNR